MEPERPIEKLLREWAKRRREQTKGRLELHPATRRMLQGEVTRKFGQAARPSGSFSAWLTSFRPRIAWGLGVFAVLAVAAWLILPPQRASDGAARMAKSGPAATYQEEFKRPPPVNEPVSAAADSVQFGHRDIRSEDQALHANSSGLKLTDEKVAHSAELAGADKDSLEHRTAPSPVTDVNRSQQAQSGARSAFGGGPAQGATGVSSESERARSVAQSASSSLQPMPPSGEGAPKPAPSSPPRPMVAAGPSPTAQATTDGAQSPGSASAKGRYGLAMGGARTDASATLTTSTPPPSSAAALVASDRPAKEGVSERGAVMSNRSYAAPSAPAATYFYAEGTKKETGSQVRRFSRVETETKAKALALDTVASSKTILATFELQQAGNEVRIVDNDGSVYTGFVQPPATGTAPLVVPAVEESTGRSRAFRSVNGAPTAASLSETEALTLQNYSFRVAGTNRSRNLPVVFTASVAADAFKMNVVTNAVALRGAVREQSTSAAPAVKTQTNAAKLRISGHAVLGDREQLDIDAVSK